MLKRTLGNKIAELVQSYPVVFLTGPRQAGKTTLARATLPDFTYLNLEAHDVRAEALSDPRGFLGRLRGERGVILDEAQRAPDLFSYLQVEMDERRLGPFVLTGSQHFLLSERITQSLAGRAAVLELLPFSVAELAGRDALLPEDFAAGKVAPHPPSMHLEDLLFSGCFPPIHDRGLNPADWLNGYLQTYVERDVRSLHNVGDLDTFTRFLGLCAGRAGGLLNASALGADAGVSQPTARKWLSVLRASYVIDLLAPHHQNFSKRLVKTPKLYFCDTGLLCFLLGLRRPEDLQQHPLRGAIFENFIVAELRKLFLHHGQRPALFFWRNVGGTEVDALLDLGTRRLPIEIKAGRTVLPEHFRGLDRYLGLSGDSGGVLVYAGDESHPFKGHRVCPWFGCT